MLITHSPNTTIDSFLSLVLTSHVIEDTTVKYIHCADAEEAMTEASFMQIAELYSINLPTDSLWRYLADVSVKGEVEARKLHNVSLVTAELAQDVMEPILKTWDLVLSKGTVTTDMFIDISTYLSNRDFNLSIMHLVAINGTVQKAYPDEFEEVLKQSVQEKQKSTSNEVLFEDDRVLITVLDVMAEDIPQALLTRGHYEGDGMYTVPMVLVLNKVTGRVVECPLEGS